MNDCYAGQSPLERGEADPTWEEAHGYQDAFYQIAEVLGFGAMPISPAHAFTSLILPRVQELVRAQKYDDTLVPFVALMRAELHANSEKGDRPGWLAMDTNTALFEIYYHMAKLTYAIRKEDGAGAREFAADVANTCMMLLDTTGLLGVPK